ncbi:hypothetical protein CEXT_446471 [Caerostris extrusa]|uniref:Uncharacterized protein n=1 Tax=Caerostris extrusa TaxID=172846 RepID=A0AAV4YCI9_CAEEX|nr:hypothetical protein CEXT_446471 [Caerostris extrusa]
MASFVQTTEDKCLHNRAALKQISGAYDDFIERDKGDMDVYLKDTIQPEDNCLHNRAPLKQISEAYDDFIERDKGDMDVCLKRHDPVDSDDLWEAEAADKLYIKKTEVETSMHYAFVIAEAASQISRST